MAAGDPHFVIGSTSPHKVGAVHDAMRVIRLHEAATVDAVAAKSGVAEQPMGLGEINMGATNRAKAALSAIPAAHYGIGIESGVVDVSGEEYDDFLGIQYIDLAVVVLLERATGKTVRTTSTGIPVPVEYIKAARDFPSCCTKTAGQFFAEAHPGSDPTDMCTTLTAGRVTRRLQLVPAIVAALMIMIVEPKKKES